MDDDLFYVLFIVGKDAFASGYPFFKVTIFYFLFYKCCMWIKFQNSSFVSNSNIVFKDWYNKYSCWFFSYDKKTPGLVFVVPGRSNFYPFPSSREKHQFYLFHQPSRSHHHGHHHDQERTQDGCRKGICHNSTHKNIQTLIFCGDI